MKVKTAELNGIALDWVLAKCGGYAEHLEPLVHWLSSEGRPATDWAKGGPIIEREQIAIWTTTGGLVWHAKRDGDANDAVIDGPTPLVAAMRRYAVGKVGAEFELPANFADHFRLQAHDLVPGMTLRVAGQGTSITPQEVMVTVVWIGPEDVDYRLEGSGEVKKTPTARFLEIANANRYV